MFFFVLTVLLTVSLYLIMRAFGHFGVNATQAVAINYFSCVATGWFLLPAGQGLSSVNWLSPATLLTVSLGILFVVVFVLIGQTTQKVGVTATSLASNMSLVIPVVFSLFVFKNTNKVFTNLNYLGLLVALVALALSSFQKNSGAGGRSSTQKTTALWLLPILLFVGSGTNNTLINYLSFTYYKPTETSLFTVVACTGACVVGAGVLAYDMFRGQMPTFKTVLGGLILGVPNFLSLYFLLKALDSFGNSAAFVFPIFNISVILVSAAAGFILFKEKLSGFNKIGLVLAVVAILLISYQEVLVAFG